MSICLLGGIKHPKLIIFLTRKEDIYGKSNYSEDIEKIKQTRAQSSVLIIAAVFNVVILEHRHFPVFERSHANQVAFEIDISSPNVSDY